MTLDWELISEKDSSRMTNNLLLCATTISTTITRLRLLTCVKVNIAIMTATAKVAVAVTIGVFVTKIAVKSISTGFGGLSHPFSSFSASVSFS